MRNRSAEELLAALETIIREFREVASEAYLTTEARAILREHAIAKIRALDFSLADAERWLDAALGKGRQRPK